MSQPQENLALSYNDPHAKKRQRTLRSLRRTGDLLESPVDNTSVITPYLQQAQMMQNQNYWEDRKARIMEEKRQLLLETEMTSTTSAPSVANVPPSSARVPSEELDSESSGLFGSVAAQLVNAPSEQKAELLEQDKDDVTQEKEGKEEKDNKTQNEQREASIRKRQDELIEKAKNYISTAFARNKPQKSEKVTIHVPNSLPPNIRTASLSPSTPHPLKELFPDVPSLLLGGGGG